jgi:hypothetical protein
MLEAICSNISISEIQGPLQEVEVKLYCQPEDIFNGTDGEKSCTPL